MNLFKLIVVIAIVAALTAVAHSAEIVGNAEECIHYLDHEEERDHKGSYVTEPYVREKHRGSHPDYSYAGIINTCAKTILVGYCWTRASKRDLLCGATSSTNYYRKVQPLRSNHIVRKYSFDNSYSPLIVACPIRTEDGKRVLLVAPPEWQGDYECQISE